MATKIIKVDTTKKVDPFFSKSNQLLLKKSKKEMDETGGKIRDIDLSK